MVISASDEPTALSEFTRDLPPAARAGYRDAFASLGVSDSLLVGYPDGDGGWITFAAITSR